MLADFFGSRGIEFDKISTSPYVRTEQTLRYYAEARYGPDQLCLRLSKVEVVPDLREHFQGDWEGIHKVQSGYSEYLETALKDPETFYKTRCPGGESPEEVGTRAANYVRQIMNQGLSRVALFTHRGTITWLIRNLLHTPLHTLFEQGAKPASVSLLTSECGEVTSYEPNIFVPNTLEGDDIWFKSEGEDPNLREAFEAIKEGYKDIKRSTYMLDHRKVYIFNISLFNEG